MERLLNLSHSPSFHIGDGDIFRYSPSSSSFLSTSLASLKSIILLYLSIVPSLFHLTLTILLLITLSFVFNYTFTQVLFYTQHRRSDAVKVPPTIPYMIPYLGSTLSFGYNALNWVASSSWRLGEPTPFGFKVLNQTMFFVTGAENINTLWKKSGAVAGPAIQTFCLKFLFGMPDKALQTYASDKSGISTKPYPESNVAPHNRVDYLTHVGLVRFLNGDGLAGFYRRWQAGFIQRLQVLEIGKEWMDMPDLMSFWEETFGVAVIEAYTGPILRSVNPDFMRDLREYDFYVPDLSRGLPRWMTPKAYATRDKLITTVLQWHAIARALFHESAIKPDGDADPYWGSYFIRERQKLFGAMDNFDYRAYAASDMGFIWGANTNVVPTTMWEIFATFKDKLLLSRVRSELEETFDATTLANMTYDVEKFKDLHLLQSVYAETLRLRISAYAARYTEREDLQINQWLFPRKSALIVSTVVAQMDKTFWNDKDDTYPVDKFWSDRFLVYPNDPKSGPWKKSPNTVAVVPEMPKASPKKPTFTTAETNGQWIPYGGGPRACPGRFFAKRAMIAACAMMVTHYDIDILVDDDDAALKLNPKFYGWGGQRPVGRIPFRIRRRMSQLVV